jgi:hypothetical protein
MIIIDYYKSNFYSFHFFRGTNLFINLYKLLTKVAQLLKTNQYERFNMAYRSIISNRMACWLFCISRFRKHYTYSNCGSRNPNFV